jgi:hypothetical protein
VLERSNRQQLNDNDIDDDGDCHDHSYSPIEESLGLYVTSVLRSADTTACSTSVNNLDEYDGLVELLQEHCNMTTTCAAAALEQIADAVRTKSIHQIALTRTTTTKQQHITNNNIPTTLPPPAMMMKHYNNAVNPVTAPRGLYYAQQQQQQLYPDYNNNNNAYYGQQQQDCWAEEPPEHVQVQMTVEVLLAQHADLSPEAAFCAATAAHGDVHAVAFVVDQSVWGNALLSSLAGGWLLL